MPKPSVVYVCTECGFETQKWLGKCPSCNVFNSLQEEIAVKKLSASLYTKPLSIARLSDTELGDDDRSPTQIEELDRVLSGGIVPGSLMLIGGEPGIGKSTLLLQLCNNFAGSGETVLYVSGEESVKQVKMRADRLKAVSSNLYIMAETDVDRILKAATDLKPSLMIIDSIQTMALAELPQAAGSVTQVRECASGMMRLAKQNNIAIILVGHATKEGNIAGPRMLEHTVDTVLYFEGDRNAGYRIIRSVKNRFGSTNEIGIFEMTEQGLKCISNPSEYMLSGRPIHVPGSVVSCSVEGTRPILTEIQALVCQTSFGMPRRTAAGADFNRTVMLLAILEKRLGLQLGNCDAYINIAGGMKITEPSVDAAICAAVASSFRNKPIDPFTVVFGEVGLAGEIRAVASAEKRVSEAAKLGFKLCILPEANLKGMKKPSNIELFGAANVTNLLDSLL